MCHLCRPFPADQQEPAGHLDEGGGAAEEKGVVICGEQAVISVGSQAAVFDASLEPDLNGDVDRYVCLLVCLFVLSLTDVRHLFDPRGICLG